MLFRSNTPERPEPSDNIRKAVLHPPGFEIPDNRTKQAQIAVDLPLDDSYLAVEPSKGNDRPLPQGVPLFGEKTNSGSYLPGLAFMAELVIDYPRLTLYRRIPEFYFYFCHTYSFLVVHILAPGTFSGAGRLQQSSLSQDRPTKLIIRSDKKAEKYAIRATKDVSPECMETKTPRQQEAGALTVL